MQTNLSMSSLLDLYSAEDAAVTTGDEAAIEQLCAERYAYECSLNALQPRDLETCKLAMDVLAWRLDDGGCNLNLEDAAFVNSIVAEARSELSANGVTLPFLISMRAALKAAPIDESDRAKGVDWDVIELLTNVLKWAAMPSYATKR